MSEILTNNKYYKDIADTIRQMKGVATTYKPREMAGALREMYSTEVEGVPPLTFPSNGNNLLNYRIDGANGGVGDRTKNLWNEDYTDIPVNLPIYKPLYLGEGTFTLSTSAPLNSNNEANLFLMSGNVTQGASTNTTGCWNGHPITAIANNGYVTIAFRSQYNVNPADYQSQLEEGPTATDYDQYGYKIPVVISGKNLLQNNATSQTKNGVTFTVNEDGSVTCNGTNHGNDTIIFELNYPGVVLPEGVYITSGCPAGGSQLSGYKIQYNNGSSWYYELGSGNTFTLSGSLNYRSRILISKNVTVTNLTFYPMLRKADITDDTYEPYIEPTTTNIYLDEPILENESISLSDTEVDIPTIEGTNTLTIDTTVQPSNVYIQAPKDSIEATQIASELEEI